MIAESLFVACSFVLKVLALFCVGCNANLNQNATLSVQSCLESYNKNNLEDSLLICNQVIEKFPDNPIPLNDRSVIYTLNNRSILACLDIKKAQNLVKKNSYDLDLLSRDQMQIRYDYCIQ